MVRNEADILPDFLAHAAALFDLVLVADHGSTDASAAILAGAGPPVIPLRVEVAGYWQAAVTAALLREAFRRGADWVLPMDADEFLDVPDANTLRGLLSAQTSPVVHFRWRQAFPLAGVAPPWLAHAAPGRQGKVALHRRFAAAAPGFVPGAGNHTVNPRPPFAKSISGPAIGTLWHLPARSREQFLGKLRRDLASHRAADDKAIAGLQAALAVKERVLTQLRAAPDDAALLQRLALDYWEAGAGDPLMVAPALAMRAIGPPAPPATFAEAPALPPGTRAAVAHVVDQVVQVMPAAATRQRAVALEAWLARRFTPGLRLARYIASRLARSAIAQPRRVATGNDTASGT